MKKRYLIVICVVIAVVANKDRHLRDSTDLSRSSEWEITDLYGSSRVMVGKNTHNPSVYAD